MARRATWRHGALDGRPELGLVVMIEDEVPLGADAIRALAEMPEGFGWPTFPARLSDAHVALWQGDGRLHPADPDAPIDGSSTRWWKHQYDEVSDRLRALGWPDDGGQYIEPMVRVDADHRVWLVSDDRAP